MTELKWARLCKNKESPPTYAHSSLLLINS